jgi:hypothetical protein
MKTTLIRFAGLSTLLVVVLTLTTAISFAKTKGSKEIKTSTQTLQVVGLVEHVNKDHSFDLVSLNGQHYHVRMGKEAMVNSYGNVLFGKQILSFDDLYSGARISFRAISNEETYMVSDK